MNSGVVHPVKLGNAVVVWISKHSMQEYLSDTGVVVIMMWFVIWLGEEKG
jgi:hypothetical protein